MLSISAFKQGGETMSNEVMKSFRLDSLIAQHDEAGKLWMEFLRVPALSAGIYRLPAGSVDPQNPHTEDEVYYIISGKGSFTCEGETIPASTGDTIYVATKAEHRFHDISDDLTILVLFAPAEID
jgi:mannose-6-phosphate isomerase-like protein (cupin superfamily)